MFKAHRAGSANCADSCRTREAAASAIAARVTGQSLDSVPAHAEGAVVGVNPSDIGLDQRMPIYESAKIKPAAVVQVE